MHNGIKTKLKFHICLNISFLSKSIHVIAMLPEIEIIHKNQYTCKKERLLRLPLKHVHGYLAKKIEHYKISAARHK